MARAVLDSGVLVTALITPSGTPAELLLEARGGGFDLVASPLLLEELDEVLRREKFRRYVGMDGVDAYLDLLRREAIIVDDPEDPPTLPSSDPDDDYLIALAQRESAVLVSGDSHLLDLSDRAPICSPADFLARSL